MTVNLVKGSNVSLSYKEPGLKNIVVGLGLVDLITTDRIEFDTSFFVLANRDKVRSDNDFIFYNNLKSTDGSVKHRGDNRTGAGECDDEVIKIDLQKVPDDVNKFVIGVTIDEADVRKQNFGMVRTAFIRIVNQDNNREIVRFDLPGNMTTETAMLFGEVYLDNTEWKYRAIVEWKFRAIGHGFQGGLGAIAKNYGMSLLYSSDPVVTPFVPTAEMQNSLGMTFSLIPAGTFMMGSPTGEKEGLGRSTSETQHQVILTRAYYMQTTQVTQGQWKKIMGNNPSYFSTCGDNCPVESVSWEDVQAFIARMNQNGDGKQYRLPTEAEWEYAARAGTTTAFSTGSCLSSDQANYNGKFSIMGCDDRGEYRGKTVAVAGFAPNAWGLYDMHGNVWEWCQDWYYSYSSSAVTDPVGPGTGLYRVVRGGSWNHSAYACRSPDRNCIYPSGYSNRVGFRLVCSFFEDRI